MVAIPSEIFSVSPKYLVLPLRKCALNIFMHNYFISPYFLVSIYKKLGISMKSANNVVWTLVYYGLINALIRKSYDKHINKHVFFIMLMIELVSIYKADMILLLLFSLLLPISITDIINNDVYTPFLYLLGLLGVLYKGTISICTFILPLVIYIINRHTRGLGLGDIDLLISLAFIFNLYELSLILFIASILNLIYSIFNKKHKYAFVPFMSIGCLLVYSFYYF